VNHLSPSHLVTGDSDHSSAVFITLGNGADLGIDKNQNLVMEKRHHGQVTERIALGRATTRNIETLRECLERLKVFVEPAPITSDNYG